MNEGRRDKHRPYREELAEALGRERVGNTGNGTKRDGQTESGGWKSGIKKVKKI